MGRDGGRLGMIIRLEEMELAGMCDERNLGGCRT